MSSPFRTITLPTGGKNDGERILKLRTDLAELKEWEDLRGKSIFALFRGDLASLGIGDISTLLYVSMKPFKHDAKMSDAFEIIKSMGLQEAAKLAVEMVKEALPIKKEEGEKDESDDEGK